MSDTKGTFEPRIIGLLCKWCTSAGADLAGTSRLKYPPNVIPVTMYCSSRIDPQTVLQAFHDGADAIFIGGCHPGDCHYQSGNYKTLKRIEVVHGLMEQLGIEKERLRLEWISAAEGAKYAQVVRDYTEEIRKLGPLELKNVAAPAEA